MPQLISAINAALGIGQDATALTFTQISLRGVIVFVGTLVIVRCGEPALSLSEDRFDAVLDSSSRRCWRAP